MTALDRQAMLDEWIAEIEGQGAVVLPHDDAALVVDVYRPWSALVANCGDANVIQRLSAQSAAIGRAVRRLTEIWYVGPWPASAQAMAIISGVASESGPRATALRIYFAEQGADLIGG